MPRWRDHASEYYDTSYPVIDDSELAQDEQTFSAQIKQMRFYVSSGQVTLVNKRPKLRWAITSAIKAPLSDATTIVGTADGCMLSFTNEYKPSSFSTAAQLKAGVAVNGNSTVFVVEVESVEAVPSNQKVFDLPLKYSPSAIAASGLLVAVGGEIIKQAAKSNNINIFAPSASISATLSIATLPHTLYPQPSLVPHLPQHQRTETIMDREDNGKLKRKLSEGGQTFVSLPEAGTKKRRKTVKIDLRRERNSTAVLPWDKGFTHSNTV
ncbi:hypothetical protein DICSQDRAFT_170098 [Dichomitus squalens LYAD-421 SS1]|uniref:Uncharacterized protein n=1 Tax=Dichomitus squalens (strain LYAD-421) TaxID=732165 RepID=R7T027_DICSQ|nr:uncharacterized protein DICSQDRAFT_170098 [Dichomitus squalens LYAD-421 SS1]EJF61335.1 hypothetical protein DICSQDRAFT_170098 [Dichomitus squalens LYAD-421 SS1]